jgi:hypothetical protein
MSPNNYLYLNTLKNTANIASSNVINCWKYSSIITGGIVFAGTVTHCLYDTIANYNKYGLSLYINGKWSYLSRIIKELYYKSNPTTIITDNMFYETVNKEFSKLKINKLRYIFGSTIISATIGPLITYGTTMAILNYVLFNPIDKLYNKYYYENPRFEYFTGRLSKIQEEINKQNAEKDKKLLELYNQRIVPNVTFIEDKPNECIICANKLEDIDQPLSCGHYFHKECFMQTKNTICPVCRTEVKLSFDDFKLLKQESINSLPSFNENLNINISVEQNISQLSENDVVMENIE